MVQTLSSEQTCKWVLLENLQVYQPLHLPGFLNYRSLPPLHPLTQSFETVWHTITSSVNIWWVKVCPPSLVGGGGGEGGGGFNTLLIIYFDRQRSRIGKLNCMALPRYVCVCWLKTFPSVYQPLDDDLGSWIKTLQCTLIPWWMDGWWSSRKSDFDPLWLLLKSHISCPCSLVQWMNVDHIS